MYCALDLSKDVGTKHSCEALHVPRASFYRFQDKLNAPSDQPAPSRPAPPLSLTGEERRQVLDTLYCASDFKTKHHVRFMLPYSMKASIFAPLRPCIVSCLRSTVRLGSAGATYRGPIMRNLNCWPQGPTKCGPGTSQNSRVM